MDLHAELKSFFLSKPKSSASPKENQGKLPLFLLWCCLQASGSLFSGFCLVLTQQLRICQPSPALFFSAYLEAMWSFVPSAGLLLLSQHDGLEDASPSPAFFFRTCLEATGSSGPSTGLLLAQHSSSEGTSLSPASFRTHLKAAGPIHWTLLVLMQKLTRCQSCPLLEGSAGGHRELRAVWWTPPIVLVQKYRGHQSQSLPSPQSSGKERWEVLGKNEDGEEGLLEGSSRPRGFLADGDCSMLRRKSRAPGASPTDVVTSPGKHGAGLMEVGLPPLVYPLEVRPPPWSQCCSPVGLHPLVQLCWCSIEDEASLVEEDPSFYRRFPRWEEMVYPRSSLSQVYAFRTEVG